MLTGTMAANGGADAWIGYSKHWRSRIWCLSPTHTGRRTISPLASVCPLPSKLCGDAHRPYEGFVPIDPWAFGPTDSVSARFVAGSRSDRSVYLSLPRVALAN